MARDTIFETESGSSSGLSLALRLQAGSADAWQEFVRLYGPLVDRWCRVAGVPSDSIGDVAQTVFLTAFRKIEGFDGDRENATFRGWLWMVTRSRIADHFRAQQIGGRGGSTAMLRMNEVPDAIADLVVDEPSQPGDISDLMHRALEQIQCEFEPSTWDMFWRATVLGHRTDIIAGENGVTTATVRQAKSRVLRRLRKQL